MNYKITFDLKSPLSISHRPTFDAIIAYAYAQETLEGVEAQTQALSLERKQLIDFSNMPIVQHKNGYFMGSYIFYDEEKSIKSSTSWKKRWANENDNFASFGSKKRKVRINSGEFKSYSVPIQLIDVKICYFFFQSNDVGYVRLLLDDHIASIGKKASQGYGLIRGYTITKLDHDPFSRGKVIRPIPVNTSDMTDECDLQVRMMGYKPPYWMLENQDFCIV